MTRWWCLEGLDTHGTESIITLTTRYPRTEVRARLQRSRCDISSGNTIDRDGQPPLLHVNEHVDNMTLVTCLPKDFFPRHHVTSRGATLSKASKVGIVAPCLVQIVCHTNVEEGKPRGHHKAQMVVSRAD